MSAVLTGPLRGKMTQPLPEDGSRENIERLRIAILQNEHVVHVQTERTGNRFVITHDLNSLKGDAFIDAVTDLDDDITRLLKAAQDARVVQFSHR